MGRDRSSRGCERRIAVRPRSRLMQMRGPLTMLLIASSVIALAIPRWTFAAGNEQGPPDSDKTSTPEYAKRQFDSDCAPCHGVDGRGDGPIAVRLEKKPLDLTLLARDNGGTFPFERVYKIIDGKELPPGHGPMPAWGEAYKFKPEQSSYVVLELANYLYRLQQKQ
jgi:mono/diheme cytochrome c family protein